MVRKADINGIHVESFELTESQFNRVIEIIQCNGREDDFNDFEDGLGNASLYVNEWINNDNFDIDYRNWLKSMVDTGASIYTYYEDWQPISEVAIIK